MLFAVFQGGDVIMTQCWALGTQENGLILWNHKIRLEVSLTQTKQQSGTQSHLGSPGETEARDKEELSGAHIVVKPGRN